jgi:hypothetical protein
MPPTTSTAECALRLAIAARKPAKRYSKACELLGYRLLYSVGEIKGVCSCYDG